MSAEVVRVILSREVSHILATRVDLELVERERLGNTNMLTVPPTPSGSSVYKSSLRRSPATIWEIFGAL